MEIARGSLWEYVGDQTKYTGSRHKVILVDENRHGTDWDVVTWCKTPAISWLGTPQQFLKQFKPTTGTFEFV